ncbi:ABC-three component system protein [Mesorhizobium sp. Mes31]|uniref:ABC-three component system protein n=1 Tax=Mesorhizobium sp. Mes31 TaxID=2926017 RepID=UPI00211863F8|nr:ABC-three component system protein [Mesorhizobium sp. Mes31]
MIETIESSLPTFKTVRFHSGLNVVLADTRPDATEKQTRNSAGKTSLLEIIHFLTGSNCDKDSLFRTKALVGHSFTGSFKILGKGYRVERSGADPAKIFVLQGIENDFHFPTKIDKTSGRAYISNTNWRVFLGHALFGMPADVRGTIFEDAGSPSFRSLFAYFSRRRSSGAFLYPERQAEQQQRGDWQVNLSYLLGLDWKIPAEFQAVRLRERTLEELKKASRNGAFGGILGTVAELRPQLTIAETKAEKLRSQLANFEVLDSYRDLSRRAAKVKSDMQGIGREAVSLHETREHLERALAFESPPDPADLQKLYAASGIELPGVALRRFDEVNRFYDSIISNRRAHLQQEIAETRLRLTENEARLASLDLERSNILRTLEGRGALDDFLTLQRELSDLDASAASLRERYKAAEVLEGESTQLDIDRVNLKRRLQEDHQQRKPALDKAILLIADAISELYDDRVGRFIVEATENGPEFRISIEGDRGGGISNVEIFCFDLALLRLATERFGGPRFLFHDSHLFDGVDARQIARALLLGARATIGDHLQYIVTMNSDIFDSLPLPAEIDRDAVVVKTRLSDETETGGLFGFRFD